MSSDIVPVECYSIGGLLTGDFKDSKVYAKKEWNGRQFIYYIRCATTGPDASHLLNPWGVHFRPDVDDRIIDASRGKRRYEFRKVSPQVFQMYVNFLETQNERYYRAAERALD